ncbi:hypothetical protein [Actinomadura nitritigenes]|uniref:hypothetical protein n=1 Tax=Actinomadura nitritigenes TaxID=134602 RepID=UPI003D8B86F8
MGTVQRTLGLKALRKLPVVLPSSADRDEMLRVVNVVESRAETNGRIARTAIALADAHFDVLAEGREGWAEKTFKSVLREVQAGTVQRSTARQMNAPFVAPADIFNSCLPYLAVLDTTEPPGVPSTILVAPKSGHAHAVVTRSPVVAGRGVLELTPRTNDEIWWLLHELRSRGTELSQLAQGTAARELSVRAFSQAKLAWPPDNVLASFARIARALHDLARKAQDENDILKALIEAYLSMKSEVFGLAAEVEGVLA